MHEAQMHEKNCFITLTYDEEHLPKDASVDVEVWKKFAKRLRKSCGKFRFIHVGEYGEEGNRPHYHALIFGLNFDEDRAIWKEDELTGRRYYRSPKLAKLWPMGLHDIQDLSKEAANYVCQYAVKKIYGTSLESEELREKRYSRVDPKTGEYWTVAEETWSMSRDPGIGADWFKKYGMTDVFPCDNVVVNGKENRPPKYYTELLKKTDSVLHETIKEKRRAKAKERAEHNTPERRASREIITRARLKVKAARKLD